MISKIGSVSRRTFSEKESLAASETLYDGDDLFITESFQPGEENSSVMGNSSYVGHIEAPPMPFEDDKDIYAESSDSTVTSTSIDSIDSKPAIATTRLSLPQRLTRTIPNRDQLSKLKEEMPWVIYGNDHVSRVANDSLDAGDDMHSLASDDFSVVGNSSVAPFDAQSTAGEMGEDSHTNAPSIHVVKTKKGLFRKFSLPKKITRILPSKQYVSKLSRLAEDVPWSMNAQEQISREAGEMLNEGDDLFISDSFEPLEADASSVIGNLSIVSGAKSTLESGTTTDEKRDDIPTHETMKAARTSAVKTPVTEKLKKAIPAPITETLKSAIPVAEKLKNAIPTPVTQKLKGVPGSVVSSSQKLMPWRLKSMVGSQARTGPVSEYQEISDDTRDSSKDLLLPSNYHTETPGGSIMRRPRNRPMQLSTGDRMKQNFAFPLSTDAESTRSRSLSWDDASCSDMSDITEPSVYSRSRSFMKAHSMYILPPGESLLGSGDEHSEAGTSTTSGSTLIKQTGDRSMTNLPNINESKPFNAMSSTEIFSPSVVNGFLNRMESNDVPVDKRSQEPLDADPILSSEDWQHARASYVYHSTNRQRVFSDSDVVYELQRQQGVLDIDKDPNQPLSGTLKGLSDEDSLTFFLDNADSSDESETDALPPAETRQQISSTESHNGFHDSELPVPPKDENDLWATTKLPTGDFVDDDENTPWSQSLHFPSHHQTNNEDTEHFDSIAIDGVWNQRHSFIPTSSVVNNSVEHTIDVDDDSAAWNPRPRFSSESEAIGMHGALVVASKTEPDTDAIDAIWSQRPRFASDTVVMNDPAPKNAIGIEDSLWRHNAPASDPVDRASTNVPPGENTIDVDAAESSWELASDSEAADDQAVTESASNGEEDATWSRQALFNADSEATSEEHTAYSSAEDFVAVIDVDENDSNTDSSWDKERASASDGSIINNNDEPESGVEHDASWTNRPRFLTEPVVSETDVVANTKWTENTTADIDTTIDVSLNPRPRFFSDPVAISDQTPGFTTAGGCTYDFTSINGRRVSSSSESSKEDVRETTIDVDHDSSSDEKPRFSPASVAINDNAANSEIEISLHGAAWRWSGARKVSSDTAAQDYYWNQSSDSEDDPEEIFLPDAQNDSFGDIL